MINTHFVTWILLSAIWISRLICAITKHFISVELSSYLVESFSAPTKSIYWSSNSGLILSIQTASLDERKLFIIAFVE